jgi:hypothetical protein
VHIAGVVRIEGLEQRTICAIMEVAGGIIGVAELLVETRRPLPRFRNDPVGNTRMPRRLTGGLLDVGGLCNGMFG